ncbi:cupin domain-containing protein [Sphingomonas jatrophae]|uniref:Cupin domain-containing protein n=1 Tax=Sphingomonas jatrophae TaxID=1166337 RepID=A0A1I6L644_9SPHN|nr:cupin domain-containing protein [Sphingomonas jatrophae]SFR98710.1 Cupin domain-containing protein [Sphingomonas jatrophae]
MSGGVHLTLDAALAQLAPERRQVTLFEDGGDATVELFQPRGYDGQGTHDRDEFYLIAAGRGRFTCGDETREVGPGDMLQVPAHVAHRFDHFDPGFAAWVIYYGPRRPAP